MKTLIFDDPQLELDIEAGNKAADTACQYLDWLLSTVNPNLPDENMWIRPGAGCSKAS